MPGSNPTALTSWNPTRGFLGSIAASADAIDAWRLALEGIAARTGRPAGAVCAFLDGRYGRDLATEVAHDLESRGLAKALDQVLDR